MKILYEREKLIPVVVQHYEGFIVRDTLETIEEAVDCYAQGPYSSSLKGAIEDALKDSSRPNPEIYYVKVVYVDNEIDKIEGELRWEPTTRGPNMVRLSNDSTGGSS